MLLSSRVSLANDHCKRDVVRGFVPSVDRRDYTKNVYAVNLSDTKAIAQPASEDECSSAAVVPSRYTGQFAELTKFIQSLGFQFVTSGNHGRVSAISGSGRAGHVPGMFIPNPFGGGSHAKLFFDAYSTSTGRKRVTVTASFSYILPEAAFRNTGWVTEQFSSFLWTTDEMPGTRQSPSSELAFHLPSFASEYNNHSAPVAFYSLGGQLSQ
jgi:hypothetical protein